MTTGIVIWAMGIALWLYTVVAMRNGGGPCTAFAIIITALIAIGTMIGFLISGDLIGLTAVMGLIVAAFIAALFGRDYASIFFS